MKRLLLSIVTLIMLIGLNACGRTEDKWDGVEIDRELYSQKIIDVYNSFGYENVIINDRSYRDETYYEIQTEDAEICTSIYWDNKVITVVYRKYNKDYFGEGCDKKLIVSLINSVAEYPISVKLVEDSWSKCQRRALSYKQDSAQCELKTYTFESVLF